MKCGYVSIVGKPNVGKSTLINAILNKDISIVSNKAQTTRDAILGIYNDKDSQIVILDTPGIHQGKDAIDKFMNKSAYNSIRGSDVTVLMLDSSKNFDKYDEFIFSHLKFDNNLIVVFNKIDLTNVLLIEKLKVKIKEIYPNISKIIETSLIDNFNVSEVISSIKEYLPESPLLYPIDYKKDNEDDFLVSEIIRKNILLILKEEVPHSVFIKVDDLYEKNNVMMIHAKIIVEKDSQKGIIIGKNGSMIKKIGIKSRKELQKMFNKIINLELVVTVSANWKNNEKFLKQNNFGKIK